MPISKEEVKHIALLSRLKLTDEDLSKFTVHLDEILSYAEKIKELDTDGVEPTSHPIPMVNVMRETDEIHPSLPAEDALANAPETSGPYFKVPKVTE